MHHALCAVGTVGWSVQRSLGQVAHFAFVARLAHLPGQFASVAAQAALDGHGIAYQNCAAQFQFLFHKSLARTARLAFWLCQTSRVRWVRLTRLAGLVRLVR